MKVEELLKIDFSKYGILRINGVMLFKVKVTAELNSYGGVDVIGELDNKVIFISTFLEIDKLEINESTNLDTIVLEIKRIEH